MILYERLTGRPPFLGDNLMEVLRQVRETAPARPSSIVPDLNRDLETICFKCLEKEPGRRYTSADALAEDLDHWLKGEPITARPVGRLERAWLWSRRNPALATTGGLAVAGLVAVTVISAIAASQARALARAERRERDLARQAEHDATAARDTSEGISARSLVRPLNPNVTEDPSEQIRMMENQSSNDLSEPEAEAMWELAESHDDRLRMRFLDEATRDPSTTRQLFARAEPAMIAAVGLDPSRRSRAAKLLDERFRDANRATLIQRAHTALVGLELEDQPTPATRECARIIMEVLKKDQSDWIFNKSTAHLIGAADRLEPNTIALC